MNKRKNVNSLFQLKDFEENNVIKIIKLAFDRRENIVGKGENAVYHLFRSFFYSVFKGFDIFKNHHCVVKE